MEAAEKLREEWCQARASSLNFLATRLSVDQLRDAESALQVCQRKGLNLLDAVIYAVEHYQDGSRVAVKTALEEFKAARTLQETTAGQIQNVAKAAESFFNFVRRESLGLPTKKEALAWLASFGKLSPSNFNHKVTDLGGFFNWAINAEYLPDNPCSRIELRKVKTKAPAIILPDAFADLMLDLETNHPEWVPYAALTGLAGMRPGIREGEAFRLDEELRKGRPFYLPGRAGVFELDGKANGIRPLTVSSFGPLGEWLEAYPIDGKLLPSAPARAERDWSAIRKRHPALRYDALRHTAASALLFSGLNFGQVALLLGTSEQKLRDNYVNPRWSSELTRGLWAVRPQRGLCRVEKSA